jgi:hypothetical protein
MFLTVGGALMGLAESLLPWAEPDGGLLGAAGWGILRYIGPDLLLYALIAVGTEAAAHAWESRQRAVAAATYARQLAEARLHVLSAQLQPHFLFNTLHAISALVWADPAGRRLLARLSEMLRLTLRSGTRVETTLAEELTLLERYAEIQETRYGDRLRVSFDVEAGVREALVPRLILQPLVENAIRHGVTRRITPGQVEVRAWQGDGRLNLTVRTMESAPVPACARAWDFRSARPAAPARREQRFALAPAPDGGALCSLVPFRWRRPPATAQDSRPTSGHERWRAPGSGDSWPSTRTCSWSASARRARRCRDRAGPPRSGISFGMSGRPSSAARTATSIAAEPRPAVVFVTARALALEPRGPRARLPARRSRRTGLRPRWIGSDLHVRRPRATLARSPARHPARARTRPSSSSSGCERRHADPVRDLGRTPPPGRFGAPARW